jgi:NADPH:quinone reductase-like Zn-dependent oxidoreductase
MAEPPLTRTAITTSSHPGQAIVCRNLPIPPLAPDELLIKTVAVSLNPSDWMKIDGSRQPGALIGVDFAGVVLDLGSSVRGWNIGDRVAGFVHGGAFASHVVAVASVCIHVPSELELAKSAMLPLGITTAAQALYQSLKLPLPFSPEAAAQMQQDPEKRETVLVMGRRRLRGV